MNKPLHPALIVLINAMARNTDYEAKATARRCFHAGVRAKAKAKP